MAESDNPKSDETDDSIDSKPQPATTSEPPAEGELAATPLVERDTSDDAYGPKWLPAAIAVGLPFLFFFVLPPLTRAGLWDPHELNVADLARRVALNLHGAADLALEGADNSLPHMNDLGRPQLPFSSIALGFKTFGLHEWAGRGPLALWGLIGVVATYGWISRLADRRASRETSLAALLASARFAPIQQSWQREPR